jgi:hypothetical protein
MVCCDFFVVDEFPGSVWDVNVSLAMSHPWVGDVVVKLQSPSGTVSTVQNRAGYDEFGDDGLGCCGNEAGWSGDLIVYDEQTGGPPAEEMGASLSDLQSVCADDGVCAHTPEADSGPGTGLDVDFDGESYAGTWQLCVGDAAAEEVGTWTEAGLTVAIDRSIPCQCGGAFHGGDRVRLIATVAGGPPLGTEGEVMCAREVPGFELLVSWDGFSDGHDGAPGCECPSGTLPVGTTSGFYVGCDEVEAAVLFADGFETGNTLRWSSSNG